MRTFNKNTFQFARHIRVLTSRFFPNDSDMNVVIMTGECHSRLIDENGFKLVVIRVNLELAFRLSIVVSSKFLKRNLAT